MNMNFWQFIFFFLYVRNWHTGQRELSRSRVSLFAAAIFLVILSLFLISIMQTPVTYDASLSSN